MTTAWDWSSAPRVVSFDRLDRERFERDVLPRGEPAILRGQVRDWPLVAAAREGDDALKAHLLSHDTGKPVRMFQAPAEVGGRFFYSDDLLGFNFERGELPLGALIDRLIAMRDDPVPSGLYAGAVPIPQHLPRLAQENDHGLLPAGTEQLVSLWIGNRSRTAAHYDLPQNIACVVAGRRRFIVLPIDTLPDLYVGPIDRTLAGQAISLVDFLDPDFEAHPRARRALARATVAELEPGDALYLPSLWWHHVESLDPLGAMINFWWREAPMHSFTPLLSMLHAFLSLRDLPERERAAWRTVFDHYVFRTGDDPAAHLPEAARGVLGELTPEHVQRLREHLGRSLLGR